MTSKFALLETVDVREAWPNEPKDFTPWLANNLHLLDDVIGIPLDTLGTEIRVGRFTADILAENLFDGSKVVIENQLSQSDNTHLGQIMTYQAGLSAQTVIWIAPRFQEDHLSVLKTLNENTAGRVHFFAIQVQVYRIADSPLAPIFLILEEPADWDSKIEVMRSRFDELQAKPSEQPQASQFEGDDYRQALSEFWTFYANRYTEDNIKSGIRWHNQNYPIAGTSLIIRSYVGVSQIGLWVTETRGKYTDPISPAMKPYLPSIAAMLSCRPEVLVTRWDTSSVRRIDLYDRQIWPQATDWLHNQLTIYRKALEG